MAKLKGIKKAFLWAETGTNLKILRKSVWPFHETGHTPKGKQHFLNQLWYWTNKKDHTLRIG